MLPEKRNPRGGVGSIEGSGEQPTGRSYPDAITDEQWQNVVLAAVTIAGGDTERGERARRAVYALCGGPFVSRPVWTAAQAVGWVFVAAIMGGDGDLKARANALVKSVLELAAESRESLGRAA